MLKAPDFSCVSHWRFQQEQQLKRDQQNKTGSPKHAHIMSKKHIQEFTLYFQRLTEHGFTTMPSYCNIIYHLDAERNIIHTENNI